MCFLLLKMFGRDGDSDQAVFEKALPFWFIIIYL